MVNSEEIVQKFYSSGSTHIKAQSTIQLNIFHRKYFISNIQLQFQGKIITKLPIAIKDSLNKILLWVKNLAIASKL